MSLVSQFKGRDGEWHDIDTCECGMLLGTQARNELRDKAQDLYPLHEVRVIDK